MRFISDSIQKMRTAFCCGSVERYTYAFGAQSNSLRREYVMMPEKNFSNAEFWKKRWPSELKF
jgi:hypothetical protein